MESKIPSREIKFSEEESLKINISALKNELKKYENIDIPTSGAVMPENKEFYMEKKEKTENKLKELEEKLKNLKK